MENPNKREKDVDEDRISRLPDPVLHHILCFVSQKKAVQTSVLSKSWRHLGPTRPLIDLRGGCYCHVIRIRIAFVCENCFDSNDEAFVSVLEKTFQRYHHQNLFTQELRLHRIAGSQSIPVLEKWIPIIFAQPNMCLNALHISFHSWTYFDPPSAVFKVESLRELHLEGCRLINHITNSSIVELNNLQNLSLYRVDISDEALEKVISGCPLIKRVVLYDCRGLRTISIGHMNRYLDYFEFNWNSFFGDETVTSIEIDSPTIQSIRISNSLNWYRNHIDNYFPRLKSLFLLKVNLPAESFENISSNFPCLEELTLDDCSGFEEIELSSRSINRLIINQLCRSSNKKVAIEVPSIRYFEFSTSSLSTTLSVTTTSSRDWKSHLYFHMCLFVYEDDNVLPRILKLFEMVKALRQSQISLKVNETSLFKMNQIEWDFNDHPVALEHLLISLWWHKREKDVDEDRISRLPDPVLHHILCFLSHKKAAQTSVLSKSWRHLGLTRPVIHLRGGCYSHVIRTGIDFVCENCFDKNDEAFVSVLEKTFQRYHHQNLFTQELRLHRIAGSQSIPVLEKWIPIIFAQPNMCLNALHISFFSWTAFDPPSPVFKVKSLRELHLEGCRLINHITNSSIVELNNLQNLSLYRVDISDEALEKVISGCPLVKRLVLSNCRGLKTIGIGHKNCYLDYFEFNWNSFFGDETVTSFEIDSPTIQSIRISNSLNWYRNHIDNYFPRLKSLFLLKVNLPAESFENISSNFPCLEELTLDDCSGFEEIELSSRSINRLIINQLCRSLNKKVAIEVPSIRYFEFSTSSLSTTLSVTTTSSRDWKSHLYFHMCLFVYEDDNVLPRILKLFEMVKALRQSQISLKVNETSLFKMNQIEWDLNDQHLLLDTTYLSPDTLTHFSNALFRMFRPRYANVKCSYRKYNEEVTEFLWKTLIRDIEKTGYGWEQHLEEVSIEAFDEEAKVWHHVEGTCLPKWSKNQKIRFRLKWRD